MSPTNIPTDADDNENRYIDVQNFVKRAPTSPSENGRMQRIFQCIRQPNGGADCQIDLTDEQWVKKSSGNVGRRRNLSEDEDGKFNEQQIELLKDTTEQRNVKLNEPPLCSAAILNDGDDDEMEIIGYTRCQIRTALIWCAFICTAGLLRLFMHWWRHWLLLATHKRCELSEAEKVLISDRYEGKHTVHYVKDIIELNGETIKNMAGDSGEWKDYRELHYDYEIAQSDKKPLMLGVHFSDGKFSYFQSIRMFKCKQLRYIWDTSTLSFRKLKGLDVNVPSILLHQQRPLTSDQRFARRLVYGFNQIAIPLRGITTLLFLEVLNPFYVFQVFSVCLWFSYDYYYYAAVIIMMSAFGISMSIIQTRKNQLALYRTVMSSDSARIITADSTGTTIETKYLVPGDILEIPSTGCTMQCDAVLLSGNCIVDESMLTGESVPVTKTPLPCRKDVVFDPKEHGRHVLFCGTKVIQTRYIGSEKVLAIVVNTGNITAKGGLVRSILYPPPVDYKFEQDSYKFIALLGIIAGVGFLYTLFTKIFRGIAAAKIAIEALDLITIAVPPALPAAMTVGRFYAQRRLEKNEIYCISPRSINVSGSIDCVCFDKTGTLTEDGLDMWGIIPVTETRSFQIPLRDVKRLPNDHFLYGMVTCHSLTIMGGELKGDPLDLKMFESTGWQLEEANVSDATKYDLLFPTVVRPPAGNGMVGTNRITGSQSDIVSEQTLNDIGIVREFSFTSSLQRMSVVTRRLADDGFHVYCKGSPEMMLTLCQGASIPTDFHVQLDAYAQQGYRIIAIAHKALPIRFTYPKIQKIAREKIECDLKFLGFVILENRLKPDTLEIITQLSDANIRTVMVTGDNILTALSVARDCDMIKLRQPIVMINQRLDKEAPGGFQLYYTCDTTVQCERPVDVPADKPDQLKSGLSQRFTDLLKRSPVVQYARKPEQMTACNSIESVATIDTITQTTQLSEMLQRDGASIITIDDLLDSGRRDDFRFAMTGRTWQLVRDFYPELLSRILTRATVFARMSPDQKQALILELQAIGYYVAMCGDGANDCGALKAAHTGISLSEAESSVASPFTSKQATVACVPNVIKEGRAALVTLIGIFKYMAAYSLVQFVSVLILYSIDSNLTDIEFLYIDLFIISVFAFFFGRTDAYHGPLVKEPPLNSLIAISPIVSLCLHLLLAVGFQVAGWYHLQLQPWFVPFEYSDELALKHACHENYTIFIISCFQYIILAIVFSKGRPYRSSIFTNYGFLTAAICNIIFTVWMAVTGENGLTEVFELRIPPDRQFRIYLIGYGLANLILSLLIELFIIDRFITGLDHPIRTYMQLNNEWLMEWRTWPSIEPPPIKIDEQSKRSESDQDPGAIDSPFLIESNLSDNPPTINRINSVLNCFFNSDSSDDEKTGEQPLNASKLMGDGGLGSRTMATIYDDDLNGMFSDFGLDRMSEERTLRRMDGD